MATLMPLAVIVTMRTLPAVTPAGLVIGIAVTGPGQGVPKSELPAAILDTQALVKTVVMFESKLTPQAFEARTL